MRTALQINERGKIASRPGPMSQKDYKRQLEQQKLQQRQAEDAASATDAAQASTTAATSTPSTSKPAGEPERLQPPARVQMETPQVVVDRIFGRMVVCAATPVFLGLILLVVFYFLKVLSMQHYA